MQLLTLRSILVATDLTESSRPALRTAARLAMLTDATLHVLHVVEGRVDLPEENVLREVRDASPERRDPGSVRVLSGPPPQRIVEHAAEVGADVVVLGPHRGRAEHTLLGSTARAVVTSAPCPCLVAATELRLPLQRVVAPVDVSHAAGGALLVALSWASALRVPGENADLTPLHVAADGNVQAQRGALHAEVDRVRQRTHDAARVTVHEQVVHDEEPARGILQYADSWSADLLVMSTRARATGHELGSVSAAVALKTPCPLLLLPPAVWKAVDSGR